MADQKKINEWMEYWVKSSKEDLKTMEALYKSGRYAFCLFLGHLVLEKALKALAVGKIGKPVPKTHNLRHLVELAELTLEEYEIKLIAKANEFNVEARYPETKMEFYKLCTKHYMDQFYHPIISLYKKLCQKMK